MTPRRLTWVIGLASLGIWTLISWLSIPSLDAYGDMVENYAWAQTWALGSFKHPPLFAWMVKAWFSVAPATAWAYFILSYLNAGLGLLGIVCLARLWLPPDLSPARRDAFLAMVLLFAALSAPYSNLAAKFNADTVLLSSWPWTAYAFFAGLTARDARAKWACAALLGAAGAAAMLGKYYSGLLLATLFLISIAQHEFRRWYRTPYPYVALAVFAGLVAPHVIWEQRVGFPFRNYLETKIDPGASPSLVVAFLLSAIYYLPLSWIAWLMLRSRCAADRRQPVSWAIPMRALVLLVCLPALLTIAFNIVGRVHLTTHWAIPDWFALPILMAVWLLPRVGDAFPWSSLVRGTMWYGVALLAVGLVYTAILSATGDPRYAMARQEMVRAIDARFVERYPAERLSWVSGTWPEPGAMALFSAMHPRALPGFPDDRRALVNPQPGWQQQYGLVLCFAWDRMAQAGSHNTDCEDQTRRWLQDHGAPIHEETLHYHAEGWRYLRPDPKNVTVFWVPPAGRAGD